MSENTMNNLKIGVDVGGTKIEAVLVDAMGTVLGSARIPARHGNDAVIEDIVAVAHQAAGERFDEVRAIGVGTPGTVDSASGHVGNIVNLDVVSLDMGPLISQRSGVPAHVENDVNAAAVGAAIGRAVINQQHLNRYIDLLGKDALNALLQIRPGAEIGRASCRERV